jgi:hypothetical protein
MKKLLKSKNNLIILISSFLFIILTIILLILSFGNNGIAPPINEDQIIMEKDGRIIIVNKNGLVEYRTADSVVYQTWSSDRVTSFFSNMERRVRDALSGKEQCRSNCIKVGMFLDGKYIEIYVEDSDGELSIVFDEFDRGGEYNSITDYFNNFGDSSGATGGSQTGSGDASGLTPTPTSAPTGTSGSGDSAGGTSDTNLPPVDTGCDAWSSEIVGGKAIISNTLCTN